MIFEQMATIEAERQRKNNEMSQWGRPVNKLEPVSKDVLAMEHSARRQSMLESACLPIDEAAELLRFDAEAYRIEAQNNQALLFVTESGEEIVPLWALTDSGATIPVAVEAAKYYVSNTPWAGPLGFMSLLENKFVVLSTYQLVAETGDHKPLSRDFNERVYSKYLKGVHERGAIRTVMDAIGMAVGDNEEYVTRKVMETMTILLDPNHHPETLETVVHRLKYEPKVG